MAVGSIWGRCRTKPGKSCVSTPKFVLSASNDWADVGRDAEPVTRDQILRRERGQRKTLFFCSIDHEQGWHSYAVYPSSAESAIQSVAASCVTEVGAVGKRCDKREAVDRRKI